MWAFGDSAWEQLHVAGGGFKVPEDPAQLLEEPSESVPGCPRVIWGICWILSGLVSPPPRGAGKDVSLSNSPSHSAPSPPGASPSYPCGKSGGSIRLDCPISAQLEHLGTAKPAHIGPISHPQTSTASALFSVEFGTTLQELGCTPSPFLPQITHQGEVTLYQDFPNPSEPGSSPCPAPSPILLFLPQNLKVSLVDLFPKKRFCLNRLLWSPRRCGTFPGTSMGSGQTPNPPTPGGTGAAPFHSISGRRILKYSLLELWKGVFELF